MEAHDSSRRIGVEKPEKANLDFVRNCVISPINRRLPSLQIRFVIRVFETFPILFV
jgi:hypothetical protein